MKLKLLTFSAILFTTLANPLWAQRDLEKIPDPDPKIEQSTFIVADGFEVNLFAADPLLAKPIQMNFDSQGRLWVASSEVYPQIMPGQQATDKILILNDTDADGVADERTVFADGLLIPTGVLPGDGGCYVANSTELIHLADTDGDGAADLKRVVLSGFGTEDTHHLLHTLRWGPDARLNMNQSIYIHSHIETPYGVKHLNGGGIWQFRPETMQLDILCRGFVNPWGHHFDRWGQSFATDGAYGEGINYVFPGSVFATAVGASRLVAGLNPGSPKHCSLEILSGSHLPDDWQGNMITNDFRANRVCRFVVSEDGSGYASRQETELIKSSHMAFRPIDVKMGPDGAIYIADWYNPIIQHGEVDFRDSRRDHVHGRIWRVTAKGRPLVDRVNIPEQTTAQLLDLLKSSAEWLRLQATLELKNRGTAHVLPQLGMWVSQLDTDHADYEHHRLQALWLYEALLNPNHELLNQLLASTDHRVRAAALRVCSQHADTFPDAPAAFANAVNDEHPRVRLEAVRALAQIPNIESVSAIMQATDKPVDRFLDFAIWQAIHDLQPVWLPQVADGSYDFNNNVRYLSYALSASRSPELVSPLLKLVKANQVDAELIPSVLELIAAFGKQEQLSEVFEMAVAGKQADAQQRAALLQAMVRSAGEKNSKPQGDLTRLAPLLENESNDLSAAAAEAVGQWQINNASTQLVALAQSDRAESVRAAALQALGRMKSPQNLQALLKFHAEASDPALKQVCFAAITAQNVGRAVQVTVETLANSQPDFDPAAMLSTLLTQRGTAGQLVNQLENQTMSADVARRAIRAVRTSSQPDDALITALGKSGKLQDSAWSLNAALLAELVSEVNQADPHRGEAVYRREELQCQNCHAIGGAGGNVGPDMVSIGGSAQVDYLIESLITPNAKIKENYHSKLIETVDGKLITGIPVQRNDQDVTLRMADGSALSIPVADIVEEVDGNSLMPAGTVDSLTRADLVDLVAFLSKLGKDEQFSIGNSRAARSWEKLLWTKEGHSRLNRTSYDTAATDDPALSWKPHYSLVNGNTPVSDLPKFVVHNGNPPTVFLRTFVQVSTPGKVGLSIDDTAGVMLWVDSKPMPIESRLALELKTGSHNITLAVDLDKRQQLRLDLFDVEGSPAQAQWAQPK
jgi:putative heme-binding domain-containing protein